MFSQEYKIVEQSLLKIGIELTNEYDGFIVKELKASNTLDLGRTTNQTHIAITGEQMDIFPYVRSLGYFDVSYSNQDADLKKYYVLQLPIYLHKTNIEYLGGNTNYEIQKVYASIVRSRRDGAADQLQNVFSNCLHILYNGCMNISDFANIISLFSTRELGECNLNCVS